MFNPILPLLSIGLFSLSALAEDNSTAEAQHLGFTGTLSSLDGGLAGTVLVTSPTTLSISSYKLEDASAPALYWWGSTTDTLKSGFRISSKQVTTSTPQETTLEIALDAGKTSADFMTVGLWCEKFEANFGQATLVAGDGSAVESGSATMTMGAAATESAKSEGVGLRSGAVAGVLVAVGGFMVGLI